MKINGAGGVNGTNPISARLRLNKLAAPEKTEIASGGDKVAISAEKLAFSKILSEAREVTAARDPDIVERIARLKEQIAAGTYKVDSEDVAESILGDIYI